MTKTVYNTTEIAIEHGVTRETVQNWIRAGKLTGQKSGRDWVVLAVDYEKFKKESTSKD